MVLNYIEKKILHLCTKAGNYPYNKGGYIASIDKERIVDKYHYKGGDLVVLRPVIDKLIFEYNFKDCGSYKKTIQERTLINARSLLKKNGSSFKKATKQNVGEERLYFLNKNYENNFVLTYKPTDTKIIIQLDAHLAGKAFMRCELNPARLFAGGMNFFRDFLKLLMCNDHKNITFETISKTVKGIKRIDIAVDLLGVDASDIEGKYIFKDKVLKNEVIKNNSGRVETHYFQMPENDKNMAYWYNKKQALKDLSKDHVDGGQKSLHGEALYTRFEYRINETDKPIANIKSLLNHLPKVHFRAIDYTKIKNKDFTHFIFLRYALQRTRSKALEMIPDNLKVEYGESYDKAIVDIWKPEQIWEKGWYSELISLGLMSSEDLKKKKSTKKKG